MTPALSAENLDVYYGQSHALRNVSFRVMPGETVSLLGRNGMGKTTLLRTLMGLLAARRGTLRIGRENVTGNRTFSIAQQGLAFVPESRGIFPNLTVEENLTFAQRPGRDGKSAWTLERIYGLFPRMQERRTNWGNQLSGGEQKMLAIGRALMTNPEIFLLDEATEGLAPKLRDEIWATLRVIRESGTAVVVVDKNLDDLLALGDRHVILAKGEVVFEGTTEALRANPELVHRHLGV